MPVAEVSSFWVGIGGCAVFGTMLMYGFDAAAYNCRH